MKSKIEIEMGFMKKSPGGLDDLLISIFWKKPSLVPVARDFLDYIKEWGRTESPYKVNEWRNYCIRNNLTQSSYHNMLKRLRKAGLIEKIYNKHKKTHELHTSSKFSESLREMANIWDNYIIK